MNNFFISNKSTLKILAIGSVLFLISACSGDAASPDNSDQSTENIQDLQTIEVENQLSSTEMEPNGNAPITALSEAELIHFITLEGCKNCYGWDTKSIDTIVKHWPMSYTFMSGGHLHAQGDDGEASMTEGTWELSGDQLHIVYSLWYFQDPAAIDVDIIVTAKKSGENLLLDDKMYTIYRL
jgi:hypothetical protein